MPKVDGLTQKQTKYVEAKVSGMPGYKAAALAYNTSLSVGNAISRENLQKPSIKEAIEKSIEANEVSVDDIVLITKRAMHYKGDTERDTLDMNLKGADRLTRLLAMTEDKQANSGGNTFIFNQAKSDERKYVDEG